MRFPAKKNAGSPKAPRDFPPRKDGILHSRSGCLGTSLPLPQSLYGRTDGRTYADVTTKIFRINTLPNFLSNGAPLAVFARRLRYQHSVISKIKELICIRVFCIGNTTSTNKFSKPTGSGN